MRMNRWLIAGMTAGTLSLVSGWSAQTLAEEATTKAQELLEKDAAVDRKVKEEILTQVQAHLDAGKRLYSTFEYEAARAEFERAFYLDRSNEEARTLLTNVNDVLGHRKDRIKSAVQQLYGEARVQAQERLAELDNRIDWGRRFIKQAAEQPDLSITDRIRRYEQGLQAFGRAHEIIKWMPVNIDVSEQQTEVDRLIRETRKSVAAKQVELQETDAKVASEMAERRKEQESQFVKQKVNILIDQAKALYEMGEYEKAETLAGKVLEQDPSNATAHTIEATARDRKHTKTWAWIKDETDEQHLRSKEKADRMNIPHAEYVIYPENWKEIAQRSSDTARKRTEEPWKQDLRKRLQKKVSFEFIDTPLDEALQFLNSLTKANIILDPKVVTEGAGKAPITLKVGDMDMETALKWILRLANLEFDLRNQAVYITTKANLASSVELEIYDVRDLTSDITDFPGPRIELGVVGGAGGSPFNAPVAQPQLKAPDLQALIAERLLPGDFQDPSTSITESGGKLVVMQRPEVHEKIQAILRSFRETQTIQVLTQVRFIDVAVGFLEDIGVNFQGLDSPTQGSALTAGGVPIALANAVAPGALPLARTAFETFRRLFPVGGGGAAGSLRGANEDSNVIWTQSNGQYNAPQFLGAAGTVNGAAYVNNFLQPRLDNNFPQGQANASVGARRQWQGLKLFQGMTSNIVNTLQGAGPLQGQLSSPDNPTANQGALFQFRIFGALQTSAVVHALRKDQNSDTLLAPRLMQLNNQVAHVMVAEQRSYISDYDVSGAVFDPVIRSFLVGVTLEVKPTVSHDRKYVTLNLRPGSATFEGIETVFIKIPDGQPGSGGPSGNANGGSNSGKPGAPVNEDTDAHNASILNAIRLPIELPTIELRAVNTTVTLPDNGTLLFSGMIHDRKIDTKSGVPLFSDLPVIGRLFSTNLKQRERRNLLILVNSKIVLFDEEEEKL